MFNKLKLRKAPLSLSSVSNAIKSSGTQNLSPELLPKHLKAQVGDVLGLPPDSIITVAFDPVQLLLAVSTTRGAVHVFGQHTVEVAFEFKTSSHIAHLRFVKGVYLVCAEALGNVTVLSLHSKSVLGSYLAPSAIVSVDTDPSLDWLILGLANGSLMFYDIDRLHMTPMRMDNLQKVVLPKLKMSPVLSVQWHPRDIGTVLVAYSHCAVQYSISNGGIKNCFVYQLDNSARAFEHANAYETGGKKKLFGSAKDVLVLLKEAHYHPNGLHIVTVHNNGTLVFWDANDGTLLTARTVRETAIHKPGPPLALEECGEIRAKWVTGQDPEYTLLLVTGASVQRPDVIDVLDFGFTLKYTLTSHEKQAEFYNNPTEGQRKIDVKFNRRLQEQGPLEYIAQILPVAAEAQPYFDGGHNPSRIILVSSLGAMYFAEFATDAPLLVFPPSLGTIVPPITFSSVEAVKRIDWFSIMSNTRNGPSQNSMLLSGGAPVNRNFPKSLGLDENVHSIMITGHENGMVKLLDVSPGEYHGQERLIEIKLKDTLNTGESASYRISLVSCSFESRELLVGLANGNVAICKFMKNLATTKPAKTGYDNCKTLHENGDAKIVDLSSRILGRFPQPSFMPAFLMQLTSGKDAISCLKMCNAGFAAIAYKSGRLIVCDISRGPAVILNLDSVASHLPSVSGECFVTSIEFAIMEYGQDGYSSLLMFLGTNAGGNFITYKIVPQQNGAFAAVFTDKTLGLNYKSSDPTGNSGLDRIMPINSSNGGSAVASLETFQKLGSGISIPGYVVVSSKRDLRVLKTPKQKLAHKVIDESCVCSGLIQIRGAGVVLASLTQSGFIKLFSLPALSDLADIKIPSESFARVQKALSSSAASASSVLPSGQIVIKMNSSEFVSLFIWDESKGKAMKTRPTDLLFNDTAIIPPRPSSSALLWAKGQTTYISSKDLALLIAGPNRKAPKNPETELAYNISPEANPNQAYGAYASQAGKKDQPAYQEPVRRGGNSNPYAIGTLGFMRTLRDGLDSVEETVNGYAGGLSESMNDTYESQKRSLYSLAIKSKLGF